MMNKTEISTFQLIFILIHAQIGVGIISLPYDIFIKANGDAWISVLLTGILIQLMILIYGSLIRRFPHHNLFEISIILFGKWLGKLFIILYIISYISAGALMLAKFSYLLKTWMMPFTPKWILLLLMCFIVIFIVKENIQIIARFSVLSSVVFIGFLVAALYSLFHANITFILPVGASGINAITKGIPPSLFSFQGIEILLLVYPFVKATSGSIIKAASIANLFITLFYTLLVVATILFFSAEELKIVPEPVLYLMKAFSSRLIERPDLLFTAMWIVLVATTFIITIYATTLGTLVVMNSDKLKFYSILLTFICFFLALSFKGVYDVNFVLNIHNSIAVPIFYGTPLLFLMTSIVLNIKQGGQNE